MAAPYVMAAMGVKRAQPPVPPPAKRPSPGAAEGAGGWVCTKCGNHNFEGRSYCNLKKCGAPGPWTCPACNNKNFANRDMCNRKGCVQPRPPPTGGMPARVPSGGPQHQQAVMQAVSLLQASGLAHVPGVQEGINKIVTSAARASPGFAAPPAAAAAKGAVMEGSWVCLGCGNINFPNRTTCNAKLCARPREEVDGGPPKQGASDKSIFMPGSWICAACDNINWPKRETCGMHRCGRPRAEVDAGAPTPQHMQRTEEDIPQIIPQAGPGGKPAPDGSWNCTSCGNLNYPNREACNARNCGKPRF